MIQRQVEQMLERLCVSKIDCVGESFDPILHEAVMHIHDDDAGPSTVVEEVGRLSARGPCDPLQQGQGCKLSENRPTWLLNINSSNETPIIYEGKLYGKSYRY